MFICMRPAGMGSLPASLCFCVWRSICCSAYSPFLLWTPNCAFSQLSRLLALGSVQYGGHKTREGVSVPWESIVELTYLNAASACQLTSTQLEGLANELDKHMHHISLQVRPPPTRRRCLHVLVLRTNSRIPSQGQGGCT